MIIPKKIFLRTGVMKTMRLVDARSGRPILKKVELADSFFRRFRGFMLRSRPPRGHGLLFDFGRTKRYPIHTGFMRFALDLVFMDGRWRVVEICEGMKPWRFYRPKRAARYLLELPSREVARLGIRLNAQMKLE